MHKHSELVEEFGESPGILRQAQDASFVKHPEPVEGCGVHRPSPPAPLPKTGVLPKTGEGGRRAALGFSQFALLWG